MRYLRFFLNIEAARDLVCNRQVPGFAGGPGPSGEGRAAVGITGFGGVYFARHFGESSFGHKVDLVIAGGPSEAEGKSMRCLNRIDLAVLEVCLCDEWYAPKCVVW